MAQKPFQLLPCVFVLFLVSFALCNATRDTPSDKRSSSPFDFIKHLQGCHKGNNTKGIHLLKTYLQHFGYLDQNHTDTDDFDGFLESAVKTYQKNYHIKPTGTLDAPTVSTMITSRCGVPDIINGTNYMQSNHNSTSHNDHFHTVSHFSFIDGNPRWPASKRSLTYRFQAGFPARAMDPVASAFRKWATATNYFTFSRVQTNQNSDITIGFLRGAHGDNSPFDGPGGTLAHAYPPTDGRFHYDAADSWSVGARVPNSFDFETLALHEIGHLLGLGHSQVQNAIMFSSFSPGEIKNIHSDDRQGIKALYGV